MKEQNLRGHYGFREVNVGGGEFVFAFGAESGVRDACFFIVPPHPPLSLQGRGN